MHFDFGICLWCNVCLSHSSLSPQLYAAFRSTFFFSFHTYTHLSLYIDVYNLYLKSIIWHPVIYNTTHLFISFFFLSIESYSSLCVNIDVCVCLVNLLYLSLISLKILMIVEKLFVFQYTIIVYVCLCFVFILLLYCNLFLSFQALYSIFSVFL